jgi:ribosomal-protein-alanine N-acetyltransferase
MIRTDRAAVAELAQLSAQDVDVDAELARDQSRIWVVRGEADRAIAFALAWAVADELHVLNVATHPAHRRQGAARALLTTVIDHARETRVRLLLLEVRRSNFAAIELYRAHGFSAIGLRRSYYCDNSEDAVEMLLALDPETGRALPGRDEIDLRRRDAQARNRAG